DPVDFRSFLGVDVTSGSSDSSFYQLANGELRRFFRIGDHQLWTLEGFVRAYQALGEYGSPIDTFAWTFSPRGADGRPIPLFDRATGELHKETMLAWSAFDLRKRLEADWPTIGSKLRGKLHVFCGRLDNFGLEVAVTSLCMSLADLKSGATCKVVDG